MQSPAGNLLKLCLAFILLSGCDKGNRFPTCYKLMAVYVNNASDINCPPAIFRIEESPDADIAAGELVTVTTGSNHLEYLRSGKVIYIKTIEEPKVINSGSTCAEKYRYNLVGSICMLKPD